MRKQFAFGLLVAVIAGGGVSLRAEDAAIKAQEGHIDHWIEYYQNQRGQSAVEQSKPDAARASEVDDKRVDADTDTDEPVSEEHSRTGRGAK